MGAGFLDIGVSGLFASQGAIDVVSHNIANVNTEGYNRQVTDAKSRTPDFFGGNYVGTGVQLDDIRRIYNESLGRESQLYQSSFNKFDVIHEYASQIDSMISDSTSGLNTSFQQFFASTQALADDPSSITARQVLLSQGQMLAQRFDTVDNFLRSQRRTLNFGVSEVVAEINAITSGIAETNLQISGADARGAPNDLLDKRDQLLEDLSKLVDISVVRDANNMANVFVGKGQVLVLGSVQNTLVTAAKNGDPENSDVFLNNNVTNINVTTLLTGGKIEGYLSARDNLVESSLNLIGRLSMGLSESFNAQHQLGMDLNNDLGGLFFEDINTTAKQNSRVIDNAVNTGNASIGISIDSTNILTDKNYELVFQGGNYTLSEVDTGTVVTTFAAPGAVPATIAVASAGFSIEINSGAAIAGDRFSVFPTRNGADQFKMALTNTSQIASALPVVGAMSTSNIGSGTIENVSVTDTTTAEFTTTANNLTPPIRIEFATTTTFNVRNATTNALITGPIAGFNPNQKNNMLTLAGLSYGYDVTLNGAPQVGDTFDLTYNTNGFGDNRNMLAMSELQQTSTMDNSKSSYQEVVGTLIGDVATTTRESKTNMQASESLLIQTANRRQQLSGVNLDEEAADLIRYEQSYQAAAQIIQVARSLFQTIIDSSR